MSIQVEVIWDDTVCDWAERLSQNRIEQAVHAAAAERGFIHGTIGIRLTNDQAIHVINVRHLGHDYPTDVISFPYGCDDEAASIEGELVASVDTAIENATDADWDAIDELVLYIIHGVLHIGGMDDHEQDDRVAMRTAESNVLNVLGISQPSPRTPESIPVDQVASYDDSSGGNRNVAGRGTTA